MKLAVVLSLIAVVTASYQFDSNAPLESDEMIDKVNSAQTLWKAGRNFPPGYTMRYAKYLLGRKKASDSYPRLPELEDDDDEDMELPESFDAREKWSYCKSLQQVRDQGTCGSCWAVSAAATLTDRFCIATEGKFNGHLSGQDLTTCSIKDGCGGGDEEQAWSYIRDVGICTGGDYQSHEGCQPYTVPSCEHDVKGPRRDCSSYPYPYPTPKCQKRCYNPDYNRTKDHDLFKVKNFFPISKDVRKMQKEIYKHGPLQAGFDVYQDFLHYKSGVYYRTTDKRVDGHDVKVIGWGTENGTDYWLVANSWNSDWGDKGFFKIRRGTNECGFEDGMYAGFPDI